MDVGWLTAPNHCTWICRHHLHASIHEQSAPTIVVRILFIQLFFFVSLTCQRGYACSNISAVLRTLNIMSIARAFNPARDVASFGSAVAFALIHWFVLCDSMHVCWATLLKLLSPGRYVYWLLKTMLRLQSFQGKKLEYEKNPRSRCKIEIAIESLSGVNAFSNSVHSGTCRAVLHMMSDYSAISTPLSGKMSRPWGPRCVDLRDAGSCEVTAGLG